MVEHERHADQRHAAARACRSSATARCQPCDAAVSSSEYAPAARSASRTRGAEERRRTAVQHGLGGGHGRRPDRSRRARGLTRSGGREAPSELDEIGILRRRARRRGRGSGARAPASRATRARAARAAERGRPRRGSSGSRSGCRAARARRRRRRSPAAADRRRAEGIGSAGGSTTIVARVAAPGERLERLAREREAERVPHRGGDVGDRSGGRWRPEHDRAVGRVASTSREPERRGTRVTDGPHPRGGRREAATAFARPVGSRRSCRGPASSPDGRLTSCPRRR